MRADTVAHPGRLRDSLKAAWEFDLGKTACFQTKGAAPHSSLFLY